MRAAAEVHERAVPVERDRVAGLGEALDEVEFHELGVGCVVGDDLVARLFNVQEGLIARNDLGHPGLNAGEVSLGEGDLAVDVVEEAAVGSGAVAELGFGEELEDGRRHDVRGGVAHDLERGGIVFFEELQRDVFRQRHGEIDDAGLA